MDNWERSELVTEAGSQPSAPSLPAWNSGSWWRHRHFHVPVVVWIVASVLGGAAIGNAVEPDRKADDKPTTIEVTSEQVDAAACDTKNDADLDDDANRPSFAAGSADADTNGIVCD